MGMHPVNYFEGFVLGNRDDCEADPACLRRAFNAAVSATHLADHFFEYHKRRKAAALAAYKDADAFAKHVGTVTGGAYKDIRSIANAYKHLYERKKNRGPDWTVASTGSIDVAEFSSREKRLAFISNSEDAERFVVIFRRRDGTQAEFLPTLDTVIDYWANTIYSVDV
jgi:hypothetical protein